MMHKCAPLDVHFYICLWEHMVSSSYDPSLKTSRKHKLFKDNRYNFNRNWPVTGLARQLPRTFSSIHCVRQAGAGMVWEKNTVTWLVVGVVVMWERKTIVLEDLRPAERSDRLSCGQKHCNTVQHVISSSVTRFFALNVLFWIVTARRTERERWRHRTTMPRLHARAVTTRKIFSSTDDTLRWLV